MLDLWRVAEKTRLNICGNNKGADQPAWMRRLIRACVVRCSSFFDEEVSHKLKWRQNDTWNLLVSHRICHFRATQPFDFSCCVSFEMRSLWQMQKVKTLISVLPDQGLSL